MFVNKEQWTIKECVIQLFIPTQIVQNTCLYQELETTARKSFIDRTLKGNETKTQNWKTATNLEEK